MFLKLFLFVSTCLSQLVRASIFKKAEHEEGRSSSLFSPLTFRRGKTLAILGPNSLLYISLIWVFICFLFVFFLFFFFMISSLSYCDV